MQEVEKASQGKDQITEFVALEETCRSTLTQKHTYHHELSTGADELSEAQQEVLLSGENLGQLRRQGTGEGKW